MDKKTGVYVCSGCGIGDSLDADKLCELAAKEYKADLCKTHPALCSKEGAQVIEEDIQGGVNTIVIAACSPRAHRWVITTARSPGASATSSLPWMSTRKSPSRSWPMATGNSAV